MKMIMGAKQYFNNIFNYNTGDYKIWATQTFFDKEKINTIYQSMLNDDYDYNSNDGKISGYTYNGNYYITEGHHRMAAALKYWKKHNNYDPVIKLISLGNFQEKDPTSEGPKKFPSSIYESKMIDSDSTIKEEIRDILSEIEDYYDCDLRITERELLNNSELTTQYHINISFTKPIRVDSCIVESIQRLKEWSKDLNSSSHMTFNYQMEGYPGRDFKFFVFQDERGFRNQSNIKWVNWPDIYRISINLCV